MKRQICLFILTLALACQSLAQTRQVSLMDQFGKIHQISQETFYAKDTEGRALLLQTVQQLSLKQQQQWHWVLNISELPYSVINLNLKPSLLRLNTPILLDTNNVATGHWPAQKGQVSLIFPGKPMQYFSSSQDLLTYINKQPVSNTP